ncbi:MAG TPA: NYN domain-containing protein, partial [Longimicrobium sp.]|nr:NYN domain-containing protein [Longimicrobium sp.]
IVMVMDILDALRHETHFDRFVIMSADADFTPVLQRLRAHDRRTAVLVSGQAAPAYRAACDRLITEDQFIELALEMPALPEPQRAAPGLPSPAASASGAASNGSATSTAIRDPELLGAIGRRVYEEASSTGTLSASELPRILREFKEFTPSSNWLGYYSLQNLAEAVLAHRPELRITDDDPWRIAVQVAEEPAAPAPGEVPPPAAAQQPGAEWGTVRDRVMERVARMVAESAEPVVMGKAAHVAIQEAGPLITETRWLGKGTFKNLLLSVPDLPFRVVASPLPGYLYDPARHADPRQRPSTDGLAEMEPEMASLVRRIHQLTDAPKLTPRQYRVLWEVIAKEITRAPYSLMSTGKAVRDQCVERGEPIARQSITLVLRGLSYAAYRFWDPPHRADNLAYTYRGNLLNLLRQAQVTLSDDELRMLDDWLMGPIAEEPHTPSQPHAAAAVPGDAGFPSPTDLAQVAAMDEPPANPSDAPPAEPVQAIEPDFATADALPADESHEPASAEGDTVAADWQPAETAAPAGVLPASEAATGSSVDAVPADPSSTAELAVASSDDAVPADESPASAPLIAADAAHPAAVDAPQASNGASVDEQPVNQPVVDQPTVDQPTVDQQADDLPSLVAEPPAAVEANPELADAIPAELSDDHGPRGPDEVTAEWEMSDEPAAPAEPAVAGQTESPPAQPDASAQPDAPSAELPPPSAAPSDEIVHAEWQPADAPTVGEAEPPAAPPSAEPAADAPVAASDEIVAAEWQPADADSAADAEPPAAPASTEPAQPETPAASAPTDAAADGILTPVWEAVDEPASPAEPPPAAPPSSSAEPIIEADAPGEPVMPLWEAVTPEAPADGSPPVDPSVDQAPHADASADPAPQMDAFTSEAADGGNPQGSADGVPAEGASRIG